MEQLPLVTIRCTVYNHEPYLRQCLEGFVMQKTDFPFEAIVHDDASTDGSADIIREYAEKYPDIIKPIYQTENQYSKKDGSLRRIMDEATRGKYVALCEGDDYWIDPFKLQIQVDFLEKNSTYSLCFHNAIIFHEDKEAKSKIFNNITQSRDISLKELVEDWIVPTASIVYRKDILPLPQWVSQIYSGDMTLALCAYNKGKIFYINKIMSFYRVSYFTFSCSSQYKNNSDFIFKQKALLFELYNEYTNKLYDDILLSKIQYCMNMSEFVKLRRKSIFLTLAFMPLFSFKKIITKISHK